MFERLKDMLYAISDLILAFFIVILMGGIITWQVTDSLAYSKTKAINYSNDASTTIADGSQNNTIIPTEETPKEPTETTEKPTEEEPSNTNTTVAKPTIIKVTIPNGSPGIKIGRILKENGLIEDVNLFTTKTESLHMGSKLKSGTFSIETGTSMEDIIYIIAGKKK
ncbi:endolytic transglycosylase MltG [Lutibacter sp. B2]|nr:endolytic transglycosylase MltG [Lutibacter sp. B2]